MLLRSSSTPILNSWIGYCCDSSPESDIQIFHRRKSLSLMDNSHSTFFTDDPTKKLTTLASLDATNIPKDSPKRKRNLHLVPPSYTHALNRQSTSKQDDQEEEEEEEEEEEAKLNSVERLFSSSGLGEKVVDNDEGCAAVKSDGVVQTLVAGGGVGRNGGRICGGAGGDGGRDGGGGSGGFFEGNNHGSDSTNAYYQKMIEADPGNALLLGNYAKFLKEVRGDLAKAEEYCGRAILANPRDGDILTLYADIIWQTQKDSQRAESYFDQAVKTNPDDCYVLASYARFLWDAEEEEEEEGEETGDSFFNEIPHNTPVTAAS